MPLVVIILFVKLWWSIIVESINLLDEHDPKTKLPGFNAVIDLSRSNALVNFAKVKQDGIEGVIHKVTHGIRWKDPKYDPRKKEALDHGLLWGAYHFGTEKSGFLQANHFLKAIGENHEDILFALMLEDIKKGPEISMKEAEDFVKTVRKKTGRYPMVYGSDHLAEIMRGKNSTLFQCPLWIAQYGPRAFVPKNTWPNWTLWQYTDGRDGPDPRLVSGIGRCDRDSVNNRLYDSVKNMWTNTGK